MTGSSVPAAGGGQITVPAKKRAAHYKRVAPAGIYPATLTAINDVPTGDAHELEWKFNADGRKWTLQQEVTPEDFADILVDLGFAGRTVDRADVLGTAARIKVVTFGGRSHAGVKEVYPATSGA